MTQAASLAKNLTVNFNRQGEWGQVLNAFYLFYNAGIQGTRTLFSAVKSKRGMKIASGIIAASMMLDLINSAIGDDDEYGMPYYDKIPDWELERNLIVMLPGAKDKYIKIPLPYGYNVFHTIGTTWARLWRDVTTTTEALKSIASASYGAFFPFGSESSVLQALSPTLLDPVVQVYENKTFYGAPMRPPSYGAIAPPEHQQYWSTSANPMSVEATRLWNKFWGGDEVTPSEWPWADISPATVDHLLGFAFGGAARTMERTAFAWEQFIADEPQYRQIPFVRAVFGQADERYDQAKYYALREDINRAQDRLNLAKSQRDLEKIKQVAKADNYLLRLSGPLRATETRLRKLRSAKKRLPAGDKRREQINLAMRQTQRRLLGYLYQHGQFIPQN